MHPSIRIASSRQLIVSLVGLAFSLALAASPALAAGTFYVDANHPNGSPAGPGTVDNPYSTISTAAAAQGGPGTTIIVKPGIYREQVTVGASGVAGSPFVIRASEPGVVIDGADLFSDTNRWTPFLGTVYLASAVTWQPNQIHVDGVRLVATAAGTTPDAIPPQAFLYVPGQGLYVNLGGDNPGAHQTHVGRRSNGFRVSGRSYVNVEGFQVYRTQDKGIYVLGGSTNVRVIGNQVTASFAQGITLIASTDCVVGSNVVFGNGDHGILMSTGVTGTRIEWNESYQNARVGVRAANGLYMTGSSGNTIVGNRWHHNQDTGEQFSASANNNLSLYNASWSNGDHGYDHLGSSGVNHCGDVAWSNYKDGFSFEGNAPGCNMSNCISTDNGLTTDEYDLWVDATSSAGFVSNSNVLWNSTAQPPVKYVSSPAYASVSAFSIASGQDTRSRQADPRFLNPTAGDFHIKSGSAAIDLADATAPGWPATDLVGQSRVDDPTVANGGIGNPTFGDAGMFEFGAVGGPDRAPVVTAPADVQGAKNSAVTVNVTASDPDGDAIISLTADLSKLGGNAAFTVSSDKRSGILTWTPTRKGRFDVTLTARNALTGAAKTRIEVKNRLAGVAAQESDVPSSALPGVLALSNAVPNPGGSDGVFFALDLPHDSNVSWSVYDIQGRELLAEHRFASAGRLTLHFGGAERRHGPGVYFARVLAGDAMFVRRFLMTQ